MSIASNFILKLRDLQWACGKGSLLKVQVNSFLYDLLCDECYRRDERFGTRLGDFVDGEMRIVGITVEEEDGPWLCS